MTNAITHSPPASPRSIWTVDEVRQAITAAEKSSDRILNLSGKRFSPESFDTFTRVLSNKIKKVFLNKSELSPEQQAQALVAITGSQAKGIVLVDKDDSAFGACYTDHRVYNEAKEDAAVAGVLNEEGEVKFKDRYTVLKAIEIITADRLQNKDTTPIIIADLGSGTGQDTCKFREIKNCHIIAMDTDEEANEIHKSKIPEEDKDKVSFYTGIMSEWKNAPQWQLVDVLSASFTYSYRPEQDVNGNPDFAVFMQQVFDSIKEGGILAGHFFGAPEEKDPGMTYHTTEELYALLEPEFEVIDYKIDNGQTVIWGGDDRPWGKNQLHHVVARKKVKLETV